MTRLPRCRVCFSGLACSLSLFSLVSFFYCPWPSFVFSASICVSRVSYTFSPLFFSLLLWTPQSSLWWPAFLQTAWSLSCLQDLSALQVPSKPHRVKEKAYLYFRIIFIATDCSICLHVIVASGFEGNRRTGDLFSVSFVHIIIHFGNAGLQKTTPNMEWLCQLNIF